MPVNEAVMDSVTAANMKSLGDGPAFYANMGFANAIALQQLAGTNAIAHQQGMQTVLAAAIGGIVKQLITITPEQAMSDNKLMTGNDIASQITTLLAALASNQQSSKVAQSTPPETAVPTK